MFTGFSGMFMLAVEFTAVRYRTYLNSVILILWALGYLLVDCAGYLIKQLVHISMTLPLNVSAFLPTLRNQLIAGTQLIMIRKGFSKHLVNVISSRSGGIGLVF